MIHVLLFLFSYRGWIVCSSSFRLVHRRSDLSGVLAGVRVGEGTAAGL